MPNNPLTTLRKPALKRHYISAVVEPDLVALLSESTYRVFSGRAYKALMPHLNGTQTVPELLTRLEADVTFPEISLALGHLAATACLAEGEDAAPRSEQAYWHSLDLDTAVARSRLMARGVTVQAIGAAASNALTRALATLGILSCGSNSFEVVVTDDYLRPELHTLNRQHLHSGRPWLLAKLVGYVLWIGPIFEPGTTACWACLAQRLEGNRQLETYLLQKLERTTPFATARVALEASLEFGANLVATEIAKYFARGGDSQLRDQVLTYNLLTSETARHRVTRRPQCPACGEDPARFRTRAPQPVTLASAPKQFTADGGHRTTRPEETFIRHQQHISPITGVVSSLVNRTSQEHGIAYSYAAGHNFALPRDDMNLLRKNMRGQSGGKGMTDIQARVSGLGEAMERYSGVYRGETEIRVRATYKDLAPQAIHLHDLLLFSEQQYLNRHEWNRRRTNSYHLVPNPFDESVELDWTPVWSMTHQQFKYVPTVYCYFGHPDLRWFFCGSDSNGCASGNTLTEAILQACLELVERDAVAIWWYNQIRRPALDLDSFSLPYLSTLQAYYARQGRSLWVLDITGDLNIPTFAAVSGRTDREVEDILVGFGAHFDPQVALLRALTELNQGLPFVSGAGPDGRTRYLLNDRDTLNWFLNARMERQPYLTPDDQRSPKRAVDYAVHAQDDVADDVRKCQAIFQQAGLEMLILDQTLPDVNFPVCRVMAPGLRHFWRRLGPGRLYQVPVQMGWLSRPVSEEDVNPYSLFF